MNESRRVLIVDDNPANIKLIADILGEGHELFFATGGLQALEIAAGVDLVLLDVKMPGMDGFETCRRLKAEERTRSIPVIFITVLEDAFDEALGFEVGGVDYITKPVSAPVVRARVRTQLDLKKALDRLQQLAFTDPLTGIGNRRHFEDYLEHEWRRALRGRHWLTLALLDVDYFKRFNDRYGHAAGDECLRAVAGALVGSCRRPSDFVGRYGGEEFALVLPETAAAGASSLLFGLLNEVRALGIEHADSSCGSSVTLSVGAVSLLPRDQDGRRAAVEHADRLLYEAKEGGRGHGVHLDLTSGVKGRIELARS